MSTSQEYSKPGAYSITKTGQHAAKNVKVVVPHSVHPGQDFLVQLGERRVQVKCPNNSGPGQCVCLTIPAEPIFQTTYLQMAPLTSAENPCGGGDNSHEDPKPQANKPYTCGWDDNRVLGEVNTQMFKVIVPPGVAPNQSFALKANGQRVLVTCPPNVRSGQKIIVRVPVTQTLDKHNSHEDPKPQANKPYTCGWDDNRVLGQVNTNMFEVIVPPGVAPNQSFALKANGQGVLVTCPPNVRSGQKVIVRVPVTQTLDKQYRLDYDTSISASAAGAASVTIRQQQQPQTVWSRTLRVSDLKFQWIRDGDEAKGAAVSLDTKGNDKFDFQQLAYCRQLTYLEGNDPRLRTGFLLWIPAKDAVVESRVAHRGQILGHYADFAEIQRAPSLEAKLNWFESKISQPLLLSYKEGHVKIVVRRQYMLTDSVVALMSLSRQECRKKWKIEFSGEKGFSYFGGVTREWFFLLTKQLFDPAFGLWKHPTSQAQGTVSIHPNSAVTCPEDHLVYFRVLGRILGRALLERQVVHRGGHMARFLYKHLLGFPITFDDLKDLDYEYYQSLRKLVEMGDNVVNASLNFTQTEDHVGAKKQVELVPNGADKEVTAANIGEYLQASLQYLLMDRIKPQLTELLLGFFDVVPEPALTIFDCNELELVLCGLPPIDMADWQEYTVYAGAFESQGPSHPVVKWFWDVVTNDFDAELQVKLLQLVIGTHEVPAAGFSVLQGNDGIVRRFMLCGTDPAKKDSSHGYPIFHSSFHRLDLPVYKSKQELREKLTTYVPFQSFGFDIE